jgi:signal peptidase II
VKLSAFRWGLLWAAGSLALDQAWKVLFLHGLGWIRTLELVRNDLRIDVLPFFDIVMVWNHGISYGLLQATTAFERGILAAFAIGVIGFLVWWLRGVQDFKLALAIGLIVGGAVGNVIDRILYGAVADFFHLYAFGYDWYVFNIADVAVVLGVAVMGLDLVLSEWRARMRGAKEDQT